MRFIRRSLGFAVPMLLTASLSVSASDQSVTYTTYEDCILTEIGSHQSQAAVIVIQDACRRKFPPSRAEIDAATSRQRAEAVVDVEAVAAAEEAAAAAGAAADAAGEAAAAYEEEAKAAAENSR